MIVVALPLAVPATGAAAVAPPTPMPLSVWSRSLPPAAPLDPSTAAVQKALANQARQGADMGMRSWNARIYVVPPNQPKVKVVVDGATSSNPEMQILQAALDEGGGVPIPSGAQPSGYPATKPPNTDSEMVIYQPGWSDGSGRGTGRVWEFWRASSPQMNGLLSPNLPWGQASHRDGKWHVVWGGRMSYLSTSPGHPIDRFASGRIAQRLAQAQSNPGYEERNWMATATSLPLLGGMVTFADWKRGVINHAVGISVPAGAVRQGHFVWPAQRDDGLGPGPMAEGMRLRLPANYPVPANQPKIIQMLIQAAKTYGFIIWDRGNAVTFRFEMQQSGNPYSTCPGSSCSNAWMQPGGPLYVGKTFIPTYVMATKFPWGALQVLKPGNDGILGPPTASPGSGIVVPSGKTVRIPVRASSPGGYPLSVQILKPPSRGSASPAPGGIAYIAAPGQSGPDSLVAKVSDGLLSSHPVKLSLLVLPPGVSGGSGSVNNVGPVVYGLTAKAPRKHHGRRRRLRLRIDSFQARRLLITVRRHHKVVARKKIKARRNKPTVVTLRFKGRHGRYKVTVRPIGRHHRHGKALHQTVRL